jgi:hypothetical protein
VIQSPQNGNQRDQRHTPTMSTHDQQDPSMTPANLKRAMADIKKYSFDNEPLRWAQAHMLVSQHYELEVNETAGPTRAADKAIAHIEEALKVITEEDDPRSFAFAQCLLARICPKRVAASRTENLTKTLACAKTALRLLASYPNGMVTELYTIIGSIYADDDFESSDSRAANEDLAIRHYLASLQRFSMYDDNDGRANRQLQVAVIYVNRKNGKLRSNVKVAIKHLLEALKVFTKSTHRKKWAQTHQVLALGYEQLVNPAFHAASLAKTKMSQEAFAVELSTLVEKCIASCKNALQVLSTTYDAPSW